LFNLYFNFFAIYFGKSPFSVYKFKARPMRVIVTGYHQAAGQHRSGPKAEPNSLSKAKATAPAPPGQKAKAAPPQYRTTESTTRDHCLMSAGLCHLCRVVWVWVSVGVE